MMHLVSICIGLISAVSCLLVLVFILLWRLRQQDSQLGQYHRTFFHQQHQLQIFQDLLAQLSQQGGASSTQLHEWIDTLTESEFYATFLWDDLLDESGEVLALYGPVNLKLRRLARSRQASRQGLILLSDSYTRRQRVYYQMRRHLASVDSPSNDSNV